MPREPLWRARFRERFGFTPDNHERARFLRNVAFENGAFIWRGPMGGYAIDGVVYDPTAIGKAMMTEVISVSRKT